MTDVLTHQPAGPVDRRAPIVAATAWRNNAALINDVAELGYLQRTDRILDPTYGRGVWWKAWRPDAGQLVTNDLHPDTDAMHHEDFRAMPFEPASFDAIAFDPPYSATGGKDTSTIPGYLERYGRSPSTPQEIQAQIDDGLTEMARLIRPSGVVLVKCQTYVWSGKLWLGAHRTLQHALALGLEVHEILQHTGRARPQPRRFNADGTEARQVHARQNYSTLYVLRRPR